MSAHDLAAINIDERENQRDDAVSRFLGRKTTK